MAPPEDIRLALEGAHRTESLVDAGRAAEALPLANASIRLAPNRPEGLAARARALRALGDGEGALAALDAVIARVSASALAHDARGVLLTETGRLDAARTAFVTALRRDLRLARAHFGFASLGQVAPEQLAMMEALAVDPVALDEPARLFLLYGLAKAYDDAGDAARAFAAAEARARPRHVRWCGDEAYERERFRRAAPRTFSEEGQGDLTEALVFVFGMPRSGATLVEQILAAHPDVLALGETEAFGAAARALDRAIAAAA